MDPHFAANFVPEMKRESNLILFSDNLTIIIVETKAGRKRRMVLMIDAPGLIRL